MSGAIRPCKAIREATKLLRESGLPFEIIPARRHHEIFVAGSRVMVLSAASDGEKGGLSLLRSALRKHGAHV